MRCQDPLPGHHPPMPGVALPEVMAQGVASGRSQERAPWPEPGPLEAPGVSCCLVTWWRDGFSCPIWASAPAPQVWIPAAPDPQEPCGWCPHRRVCFSRNPICTSGAQLLWGPNVTEAGDCKGRLDTTVHFRGWGDSSLLLHRQGTSSKALMPYALHFQFKWVLGHSSNGKLSVFLRLPSIRTIPGKQRWAKSN